MASKQYKDVQDMLDQVCPGMAEQFRNNMRRPLFRLWMWSSVKFIESRKRGATRDEIAKALGLPLASVCGRVNELLKRGAVIETDQRRTTRWDGGGVGNGLGAGS